MTPKQTTVHDSNLSMNMNIYIGRNAKDNWDIYDNASAYDLWFHVSDESSKHVILHLYKGVRYEEISDKIIRYCADLCCESDKFKGKSLDVIYTPVYNIVKGKDVGSMNILNVSEVDTVHIKK